MKEPAWSMLEGLIKREFKVCGSMNGNQKQKISGLQIWDPDQEMKEGILYLDLSGQGKPGGEEHGRFLLSFLEKEEEAKGNAGYFLIVGKEKKILALNRILQIYIQTQRWMEEVRIAAREEKQIHRVVQLAAEYLNVSVAIVNSDYEVREYVEKPWMPQNWCEVQEGNGIMTSESIEELYLQEMKFEDTFAKKELAEFIFLSDQNVRKYSYYKNFTDDEERYLGRILFMPEQQETDRGIFSLMEFAAQEAQECFLATMQGVAPVRLSKELHELLEQLLEHVPIGEMTVSGILERNGWELQSEYCMMKLISNGNVRSTHTLAYYCHLIEREFPYICAIEYSSGIVCMANFQETEKKSTFHRKLPYFLRENLFLAGISGTFEKFTDCEIYMKEAACALSMGMQKNSSFWIHLFSEYALEYSIQKMTEEYPVQDLIYSGLRILEEYDREHPGTDLERTLREYLRQMYNATHTAQALHIHRTTFLYRLRRIVELTGMKLESEQVRLHLQLSYVLKEEDEKRKSQS